MSTYEKQFQKTIPCRDDPECNVINLSKYLFTKNQSKVLNKNYCPTPGYYNMKEIKTEIKNFENKIKVFFEVKERNNTDKISSTRQIYLASNQN